MAFQHNNFTASNLGTHPAAYGRVVSYQWVREGPYAHFVYDVYHNADAAGGAGGSPKAQAVERHDFTVKDTAAIMGPDGTVLVPAITTYTDLFKNSLEPLKACYLYLARHPLCSSAIAV